MTIFNALVVTAFLILFAASVAVVGSIIVLAIFDLTFGKKKPPVVAETTESDQLHPPSRAVQCWRKEPPPGVDHTEEGGHEYQQRVENRPQRFLNLTPGASVMGKMGASTRVIGAPFGAL